MDTLLTFLAWAGDNAELIGLLAVAVLALLKTTTWGRANKEALEAVAGVVEASIAARAMKGRVQAEAAALSPAAQDALADVVARVDPAKRPPSPARVILREAGRLPRRGRR